VVLVGGGISFGLYINPGTTPGEEFDVGFMGSLRAAVGGDISGGIATGTIDGPAYAINGLSTYSSVGAGTPAVGAIPGIGVDFVKGETIQSPFSETDPNFEPVSTKEYAAGVGLAPVSSQKGMEASGKLGYQDVKAAVKYIGGKVSGLFKSTKREENPQTP